MNRAVFLDRDGVMNPLIYNMATGEYESPHEPDDFSVYTYLLKSLRLLRNQGFNIFLISNQPSYAKGKTSLENIKAIENMLKTYVEENGEFIDGYYYCYHHPEGCVPDYSVSCDCRKPGIRFLLDAARAYDLDLASCFFVGDQDTDIQCGKSANMKTIKICNKHSLDKSGEIEPDAFVLNIYEAAERIIRFIREE